MAAVSLFCTACRTVSPLAPVDLNASGWHTQTGQAVWKPNRDTPELAGDLILSRNTDGRSVVQFIKTPFPLAIAQVTSNRWQIEFPADGRKFAGSGRPPKRIGWLQFLHAMDQTAPPTPWTFHRKTDGTWLLENPKSGERIEGFLTP